ncbi:uncharacterized protein LOC127802669 isoform X2 [Diospyros lotus]|uniref:uncharacterized protein LOC127802668 isoform X2 n=1 Tax=Diospyros lotus TaxID=55363 RepID=UPI00225AB86A|nr:uncharacterized protein LOC127802668 isoform X2 [Diospyros lotus]XP_052194581.1 uncharacterized protein LOC127802669 isoform X2 [Diospyros lotus]
MAGSVSSRSKVLILLLITAAAAASSFDQGAAVPVTKGGAGQILANALLCFNKKIIYSKCYEAYRLDERGYLNVPPQATDLFCNGPCLAETQGLLKCIDNTFSNFRFNNKATMADIRGTIQAACSFTKQRGNFNVGDYIQSESSSSTRIPNAARVHAFLLSAGCLIFLF